MMAAGQWIQRREWIQEIFKGKKMQFGKKKKNKKFMCIVM